MLMIVAGAGVLQLGRTIGCYSLLLACMAPSSVRRASPQGGGFQVRFSSIPLSFGAMVCGVFSNRVFFWKAPRTVAIAYVVLGVSWILITNSSKRSVPCLAREVVSDLGGVYYYPKWCNFN